MMGISLYFSMYFMLWLVMGDLPEWLSVVNVLCLAISMIVSVISWENHKSKVKELKEQIERLKELQNGK